MSSTSLAFAASAARCASRALALLRASDSSKYCPRVSTSPASSDAYTKG
eukprot:CAMPEP_0171663718 /NCGR_PEP_ID=MMETSP0990-20121206/46346_1 /TAXON_ID=483369 /ORGANISM="non described non described, Strain CCMP2098" /LENGTH=48 /DNA_ID= /DNA_START= /DNA_END= /DNA_ORIENTATION=